ncbi:ATP-binding cassette sub-family A member 7 [Microsporum canis CBS 113480]|uniref:ATP-binding cassette sub-family A member 7 n=1 Tax=Arthroderma otae (strain ATCC MYA-4605 / CBS 113480) TaxID=554155 RepID=C5FVJ2_ARTOC|nr:ATP-binding cassette sub-family A member 7 [Microsporum canis CBS 113480]EEQ33926.1 ATP-binding cassette sub-family A member 7 [Microsporum canis CBS 113480]
MAFTRQVWALVKKNFLLALVRPYITTPLRAFVLPVVLIAFLSFARNLFVVPSKYGIASPSPILSLDDALKSVSSSRNNVVFVNNGFENGDITRVIDQVSMPVRASGKSVTILSSADAVQDICKSSILGTSSCIAVAVFASSPNEGNGGRWNYTIKADGALGKNIDIESTTNDAQTYILPFQHAIDRAIASVSGTQGPINKQVMQYPYTSKSEEERIKDNRIRYTGTIISILGIAFLVGSIGITYQLTGLVATERELGISQLIDCMIPTTSPWKSQAARFLSVHLALDIIYLPGWIAMAIILKAVVFTKSSVGIQIIFQLLAGLSLASFALFGASFFKKAQLSGITVVITSLGLGIVAQVVHPSSSAAVAILSLLFPPMNFINFVIFMARWERQDQATNLVKSAPESPWSIPGIVFWIFAIIHIIVFPILAAIVERLLHGTGSKCRKSIRSDLAPYAVSLNGFTKEYKPSWFHRTVAPIFGSHRETVLAVDDLNLNVNKGEIMVLLGANGSGKSTTLDAISGVSKTTSGEVSVAYPENAGGFGMCPQKNVIWDKLTVQEHISIFNGLKTLEKPDSKEEIAELVAACDLDKKLKALAGTLSGGQKRKLQLAMMFTGGSSVCCVDEVSSGLDPISRRKIWDILLAERGKRTILLTTHFLDEADVIADRIAILSKGVLKAEGSSVELKHKLGSGYRIYVYQGLTSEKLQFPATLRTETLHDQVIFTVADSSQAARFVSQLEEKGITEYRVSGPTIEDVFLKVAEEIHSEAESWEEDGKSGKMSDQTPHLLTGHRIGMVQQAWVLLCKRATILRRNYLPTIAAFLLPIIAAGLVSLLMKDYELPVCTGPAAFSQSNVNSILNQVKLKLVIGPSSKLSAGSLISLGGGLGGGAGGSLPANVTEALRNGTHVVNSLQEFNDYIATNFRNVTPGGFYLGDDTSPPTLAWKGNSGVALASILQNQMDNLLYNISISTQYQILEVPWISSASSTLQLIIYLGLALSAYPAFFSLYLTIEKLRHVRDLHYSNGVRSLPLWLSYLSFDFAIALTSTVIMVIVFRAVSSSWYHLEYLFVVFFLYAITSTLFAYIISVFASSQLAAFAFAAGGQAILFLVYLIAYMSVVTYAPTDQVQNLLLVVHFAIATISPIGNVIRSLFVALNVFSTICRDKEIVSYPGDITAYGGPILYLILQALVLFGVLLFWDSGLSFRRFTKKRQSDREKEINGDPDLGHEIQRVSSANDGLRAIHLTKTFGKFTAVEDVTFGVPRGEVFALLGPNGAGKSTTISLIRGDIQPSNSGGEIFVENIPVTTQRATARSHMGVCPQFDAIDQLTVLEHLRFYARIRGIPDVEHNVREVIRAVGLTPYGNRMAMQLSGGNKRKLSLGIALMGNPTVLLLDEPSSGMDAASKRVMWRTLESVVPGRSLVLTTHSMEEADALATRAGIMAKRMLAIGTTDDLRRRHGNAYHVHIVHQDAPHTSVADMEEIRAWVASTLPGASIERKTYHGQLRFSLNGSSSLSGPHNSESGSPTQTGEDDCIYADSPVTGRSIGDHDDKISTSKLFSLLEQNKERLHFAYYSVSQTTLDQVFLTIVGQHNIKEEGE